jgi:hypothetical protein
MCGVKQTRHKYYIFFLIYGIYLWKYRMEQWTLETGKGKGERDKSRGTRIDLPYDPAVPLLGIYPKECKSAYSRDTCTPVFYSSTVHNSQAMKSA